MPAGGINAFLRTQLDDLKTKGLYKAERRITSPQRPGITVNGQDVVNFCANNYLGLANHPDIVAAAHEGLREWGYGLSSVRFICGTQDIHMAKHALTMMARGGMCDQAGGGFARYSVDAKWLVPHFEKMLYDNARLARPAPLVGAGAVAALSALKVKPIAKMRDDTTCTRNEPRVYSKKIVLGEFGPLSHQRTPIPVTDRAPPTPRGLFFIH